MKSTTRTENPAVEQLADQTPISEVMTRDVVCVRPELDIETLIDTMLNKSFSGAPVVDDTGRAIGIVSKTDLLRAMRDRGDTHELAPNRPRNREDDELELGRGFHLEEPGKITVADIMMPVAFTLSEHAPISQAAALMAYECVHRIPVLARDGGVAGIVSSLDILRWVAAQSGYLRLIGSKPVKE